APAPLLHSRKARLGHVEAAAEVDAHDVIPVFEAHLEQGAVTRDSCVVDQDVDRSDFLFDLATSREARLVVADIPLVGRHPGFVAEGTGLCIVAGIVGHDSEAFRLERFAYGSADAPSTAGD